MTDGIARAMSAGCQSPLAPSDEGAVTEGDWGRDLCSTMFLVFIVSPSVASRHLPRQREALRCGAPSATMPQ